MVADVVAVVAVVVVAAKVVVAVMETSLCTKYACKQLFESNLLNHAI